MIFLKMVRGAIDGGAMGIAVGRNVWQSKQPVKMLEAINLVIHEGLQPQAAFEKIF